MPRPCRLCGWAWIVLVGVAACGDAPARTGKKAEEEPGPTAAHLLFHCPVKNIGAFHPCAETIRVPCSAYAEDAENRVLPGVAIRFLAEAGAFPADPIDGRIYLYDPRSGGRTPVDVAPDGAEPSWSPDDGLTLHNPRDGLVTLVAFVPGAAGGLPDPYVDANDNGAWDEGEEYFDADGDGAWSAAQDKVLWKATKILWSGALHVPFGGSNVQPNYAIIERESSREFTFTLLDRNLNVLAANGLDDRIDFIVEETRAKLLGAPSVRLANTFGIDLDPVSYRVRAPESSRSYLRDSAYSVGLLNTRDDVAFPGDPPPAPEPFNLRGEVRRTCSMEVGESGGGGEIVESTAIASGWMP